MAMEGRIRADALLGRPIPFGARSPPHRGERRRKLLECATPAIADYGCSPKCSHRRLPVEIRRWPPTARSAPRYARFSATGHMMTKSSEPADTRSARAPAPPLDRLGTGLRRFARRRAVRYIAIIALDFAAVMATVASVFALADRGQSQSPFDRLVFLLFFASIATAVFVASGLYRRSWRYFQLSDALFVAQVIVLGLGVAWLATLAVPFYRHFAHDAVAIAILDSVALIVLMMAMRAGRRLQRERRQRQLLRLREPSRPPRRRVLLLGPLDWASSVIELVRLDRAAGIEVVGVLLPALDDPISRLSGVPVLGGPEMLAGTVAMLDERGRKPEGLILCDDAGCLPFTDRAKLIVRAHELGLELGKVSDPCAQLLRPTPRIDVDTLPVAELLGRPEGTMQREIVAELIRGRRVLVTGAGGTIGSELVKQLASFGPAEIVLLDHAEHSLYAIDMEARECFPDVVFHQALCSIRRRSALNDVFARFRPEYVFHAAALKHVPIVEANPCAGVHTNVIGTRNVADAVCAFGVRAMVQVSTDKAVNPVGMMGVTKRLGELYAQALDVCGVDDPDAPRFVTVRFGNVLGSSGSIVPLFKRQISEGRALTVTHPDITRFFMTVKESVQLILQSSAYAVKKDTDRGNIYVLDMGEPVRIIDMARQMIVLAGLEPDVDIDIRIVGLRPGEKLYEELFDTCEQRFESRIDGIFEAHSRPIPLPLISRAIDQLEQLVADGDDDEVCRIAHNLVKLPNGSADMSAPFGEIAFSMAAIDDERRMIH
ncbi:polysaccharide biosynthesis protein [Sphingomonas koreensis]|nr:polysaccharide biosynthesis protein [Sphingomonas koreensis]